MATAITPSLRANLEKLKHAGAVNGLLLSWRRQVLVSLMPYEDFRVEQLVQTANDAREHFERDGTRMIESLWMAFMDVHVLCIFAGETTLIALHIRPEEADLIASAARTMLNDTQILVAAALGPPAEGEIEGTEDSWLPQPPRLDPNQTNVVI